MSRPKLTWFSMNIKPVHIGVYMARTTLKPVHIGVYMLRITSAHSLYAHWDGMTWGFLSASIQGAIEYGRSEFLGTVSHQDKSWRGLTTKAE